MVQKCAGSALKARVRPRGAIVMEPLPDRLPLVIGVTGHRDLRDQDLPQLEERVTDIITRLRHEYLGRDHETPVIILSALAEGADRLVARVALAQGARLIAPLPLPLDEYRRDFEPGLKPGNGEEFERLLAQAMAAPVVPFAPGISLETVRADRKKRAVQYRAVGLFIAQHCHVLLALWDGDETNVAVGGTAEVVAFKRDGIPLAIAASPRASLDASETGPVIQIITPRTRESNTLDGVAVQPWGYEVIKRGRGGVLRRLWHRLAAVAGRILGREQADERMHLPAKERRDLDTWESFEVLIGLTREFNAEAAALARMADGPARMAQSVDRLFSDAEKGGVDGDARTRALAVAARCCALFGIADTFAQDRQQQFVWDWKLLFSFGLIAFLCFAIVSHAGIVRNVLLAVFSLSFAAIVALYLRARLGRHQERFLDYRALAEALRVAVYLKLVGIGARDVDAKAPPAGDGAALAADPADTITAAYPIRQPAELAWVKVCLRNLERLDQGAGSAAGPGIDQAGHDIARRCWVRSQSDDFARQEVRCNALAEAVEAYSAVFMAISAFVLVPLLISGVVPQVLDIDRVVLIAAGLLPAVAAALAAYSQRLALRAQARQYDRLRMLFERAYALLPERIDEHTAPLVQQLYLELGNEAMKESAEWVAIHRPRPIQPQTRLGHA
jgi:hypothetical protein